MNTDLIKILAADTSMYSSDELVEAFENLPTLEQIKNTSDDILAVLKDAFENYGCNNELSLEFHDAHNTLCSVNITEFDFQDIALAFALAVVCDENSYQRMDGSAKNQFDFYLEYLDKLDSDMEKSIAFFKEYIGNDICGSPSIRFTLNSVIYQ